MTIRTVGSYHLGRKLGEGGQGIVYLARHRILGSLVAIKELTPCLAQDAQSRLCFLSNAQAQAQLSHLYIVEVKDFIEDDSGVFLIMEYMPGGSLEAIIRRSTGPLDPGWLLPRVQQALSALDLAHQKAVIHSDIKPSNILLDAGDNAKVSDFGIAIVLGSRRLTATGTGNPYYSSPERITRPHDVDHRTDIYSIGIVLYEMLTGRVPFNGGADFKIELAQVNQPPPPPRQWNPAIPEMLEQVVLKALAKDPAHRFADCGELSRALEIAGQASHPPVQVQVSTPGVIWQKPATPPLVVATPVAQEDAFTVPPASPPPLPVGTKDDQPYAINDRHRWRFVMRYCLTSAVAIQFAAWSAFGGLILLFDWDNLFKEETRFIWLWLGVHLSFLSGALMGLGQWLVLRRAMTLTTEWILALGGATFVPCTSAYVFDRLHWLRSDGLKLYLLTALVVSIIAATALVLHRHAKGTWYFCLTSLLGWSLAIAVAAAVIVLTSKMTRDDALQSIGSTLAFGAVGVITGFFQALALLRLRSRKRAAAKPKKRALRWQVAAIMAVLTLLVWLLP